MAKDPDWAELLERLYLESAGVELERKSLDRGLDNSTKQVMQAEALCEKLSSIPGVQSSSDQIDDILDKLDRWGLVYRWESGTEAGVRLEEEGFNVAHERELTKRQNNTNRILAGLTAALVFAGLVQALVGIVAVEGPIMRGSVLAGTVIIGIAILYAYRKFELSQ